MRHDPPQCSYITSASHAYRGANTFGQLGLGDTDPRGTNTAEMGDNLPAVELGSSQVPVAIALGGAHACALLSDGSLKCWGANNFGQLGQGDSAARGDEPNEMGDNLMP